MMMVIILIIDGTSNTVNALFSTKLKTVELERDSLSKEVRKVRTL